MEGAPAQHHLGSCSLLFLPELQASYWESLEMDDVHTGVAESLSLLGHVLSGADPGCKSAQLRDLTWDKLAPAAPALIQDNSWSVRNAQKQLFSS